MSDTRHEKIYRPLGLSIGGHLALAAAMTISWYWHTEQKVTPPAAIMKASLVYAPKSTLKPLPSTDIKKPEPVKPEPPKPEPPKPEPKIEPPKVEPKKAEPPVKTVDKPSPIVVPDKPVPPKPVEPKKVEPKKVEPPKVEPKKPADPKTDTKKADKKQQAQSQVEKPKVDKTAEAALAAAMEVEENILQEGELNDDETAKWDALIRQRIMDNWNRPPNARREMKVTLEIELSSSGQVISVHIVSGSGNTAFDLSAESAVRKVERFDEITKMKPGLYEKAYRKFQIVFDPEDLLI